MKVRIRRVDKKLPLPEYKTAGAVAFDFLCRETVVIPAGKVGRIPANVVIEVPEGYMLHIKDRSSTAMKKGLLATAGVIDQDYCGDNDEIVLQFYNFTTVEVTVERGERIAQGVFMAIGKVTWDEVDTMQNVDRGGFGSTG